ncbi:transcription factor IIIB 90 kDa subunit-like [Argopecten irradians]|uniref:transcription factor IIIB 90 kDa subunit-like n=1 Tax=Argopecten irradians TaxID=31199 RepID=UPI003716B1C7
MSSTAVCSHCGCTDIDKDPARGDAVCTNCGSVLEDQIIVSEVQFEEHASGGSSVIGQFVSSDGMKAPSLGISFPRGMKRESRTVTFENGRRRIQQLGAQLKLNQHCIDTAFNFYKMAVVKQLTRGRKTAHVTAACLYLVCRTEGTPHMLLDFSDQLQINVYSLGKTYLQLSRELCLNIPAIDPCLYIQRFAHKLEFEDKTHDVSMIALRLVQRMKRDWMHTGRRPSGLCGAALLVAARMSNFNRSVKDIIKVVKVCDTTIRKRLAEFQDTPSSLLTIEEFQNIDLEAEHDPPSFTEGKKRALQAKLNAQLEEKNKLNELTCEVSDIQEEIEKSLQPPKPRGIWAAYAKTSTAAPSTSSPSSSTASPAAVDERTKVEKFLEKETLADCVDDQPMSFFGGPGSMKSESKATAIAPSEVSCTAGPTGNDLGITDAVKECLTDDDVPMNDPDHASGELDLAGIDDEELDLMLLNEDEVKIKTDIWMKENGEFLQAQKEKQERLAREKELEEQNPDKKKRRKHQKRKPTHTTPAASGEEAIVRLIQEKKISTKINYDVLNDLKVQGSRAPKMTSLLKFNKLESNNSVPPALNRLRKPSISPGFIEGKEPSAKKVKLEIEPATEASDVVIESGPVQYTDLKEEELGEDEEDYEEEEDDHLVSAGQLLGRGIDTGYDHDDHDMYDAD